MFTHLPLEVDGDLPSHKWWVAKAWWWAEPDIAQTRSRRRQSPSSRAGAHRVVRRRPHA